MDASSLEPLGNLTKFTKADALVRFYIIGPLRDA